MNKSGVRERCKNKPGDRDQTEQLDQAEKVKIKEIFDNKIRDKTNKKVEKREKKPKISTLDVETHPPLQKDPPEDPPIPEDPPEDKLPKNLNQKILQKVITLDEKIPLLGNPTKKEVQTQNPRELFKNLTKSEFTPKKLQKLRTLSEHPPKNANQEDPPAQNREKM